MPSITPAQPVPGFPTMPPAAQSRPTPEDVRWRGECAESSRLPPAQQRTMQEDPRLSARHPPVVLTRPRNALTSTRQHYGSEVRDEVAIPPHQGSSRSRRPTTLVPFQQFRYQHIAPQHALQPDVQPPSLLSVSGPDPWIPSETRLHQPRHSPALPPVQASAQYLSFFSPIF